MLCDNRYLVNMNTLHIRSSVIFLILFAQSYLRNDTWAQEAYLINTHQLSSSGDALGLMVTERSAGIKHLDFNLGIFIDSAAESLSFTGNDGPFAVLDQTTSGQVIFALGLWDRLNLSISQFVHISQYDFDGPQGVPLQSEDGLGLSSLSLKGIIFDSQLNTFGLALAVRALQSLASPLNFLADSKGLTLEPSLIIDANWTYFSLAVNLAYLLRPERELNLSFIENETSYPVNDPIFMGSELAYRSGIALKYIPKFLHHSFELLGAIPVGLNPALSSNRAMRLELISGLKLLFNQGSYLTIGAGRGLVDSYSNPKWRAFMGIMFHPKPKDNDGDGIYDAQDQCPSEAEDIDQFEDQDGCPDLDNDYDGLNDLFDQCPNQAEDKNDFEDDDGCPDAKRDLDGDGIYDPSDRCPQQAEDRDNFADQDGCPDEDNDLDQIPDNKDRCPNQAEDYDGVKDQDGCPDPDNDGDGIPDYKDRCPLTPEDLDGDADDDGCPEQGSKAITDVGAKLKIKGTVYFDLGKAVIKSESYQLLLAIALFVNERPFLTKIEVQGHTDRQGSRAYNIKLSQQRALAVKNFLVREGSVDAQRLQSKGYGFDQPLVEGQNKIAQAKNRRVEFVVIERDDR